MRADWFWRVLVLFLLVSDGAIGLQAANGDTFWARSLPLEQRLTVSPELLPATRAGNEQVAWGRGRRARACGLRGRC